MWLEQIALHRQYHQKFVRTAAIENNPRENVYERIDSTNADKYVTSMMDELGGKRRRTIDRCSETMSGDRPFAEGKNEQKNKQTPPPSSSGRLIIQNWKMYKIN